MTTRMTRRMWVSLQQFNQANATDLEMQLKHCVPIQRWAHEIIAQRPFASMPQLLQYAEQQAETWLWAEVEATLAHHPRIGQRQAQNHLSETEQRYSAQEQALIGVESNNSSRESDLHQASNLEALLLANQRYEDQFGFIFLIKAFGLNQQQILDALAARLDNDLDTEKHIVQQQLKAIALLRLTQELQA